MPHKSSTNLKNRVIKLHLSRKKPLLPLFEIISNANHATQEKKNIDLESFVPAVFINVIRYGDAETYKQLPNVDAYPVESFIVTDNGIGFDAENMKAFAEFDTDKKASIGGKGVGRLVCLKAFERIRVESVYREDGRLKQRKFEYKKSREGFDNEQESLPTDAANTGSTVELYRYEKDYQKNVPCNLYEIAKQIVNHFQLYFIARIQPEIMIQNQNSDYVRLSTLYQNDFARQVLSQSFYIGEAIFTVFISKAYNAQSHKIHYCSHYRSVKEEGLSKYNEDLRLPITDDTGLKFHYQVFVTGPYLDDNVNEERTNFNFSTEEDEDDPDVEEISLARIRKETLHCVEELLSDYLATSRSNKLDAYIPIIREDYPNYLGVINHNRDKVERLPIGLSKTELDLELYKIESQWRVEVKKEGIDLLDRKKDITTLPDYQQLYQKFLSEFNDIGQSDLARYIVHRRSVIDLLDKLIELNAQDKFANEDIVHSLFFPIKETGQSVLHEKQNLWLLDERLTFNTLLASDKTFNQTPELHSTSADRMDLIVRKDDVFFNAALYSEDRIPYESFTIVEFKKPERDDYEHGDRKKDPIKQVRSYIQEIVSSKAKVRGKSAGASLHTPFYCYIVAYVTPSLQDILNYESFVRTADGLGFFKIVETIDSKAYIEVLPFKKVIKDAKQRNKILFDKLKLT